MTVKLKELRSALNLIFQHLENKGVTSIQIQEDYYWNVSAEEVYDPSQDPSDLNVGHFTEDWGELQAIASGAKEPIGYGLVWSAAILRRIGELNVG